MELVKRGGLLTPRQLQIGRLVCGGLTTPQIGARLGISPATVSVHRGDLYMRLDVDNVAQMIHAMVRLGLWQPGEKTRRVGRKAGRHLTPILTAR